MKKNLIVKSLVYLIVSCIFISFGGVAQATEYMEEENNFSDINIVENTLDDVENYSVENTLDGVENYSVENTLDDVDAKVAPLIPAIIAWIVRSGLKSAVKKWGKTVVGQLIRTSSTFATAAAKDLGYSKTNLTSHGKPVYKIIKKKSGKPNFISPDGTGHLEDAAWKGASTAGKLSKKSTRSGTYDAELNRIGD